MGNGLAFDESHFIKTFYLLRKKKRMTLKKFDRKIKYFYRKLNFEEKKVTGQTKSISATRDFNSLKKYSAETKIN